MVVRAEKFTYVQNWLTVKPRRGKKQFFHSSLWGHPSEIIQVLQNSGIIPNIERTMLLTRAVDPQEVRQASAFQTLLGIWIN